MVAGGLTSVKARLDRGAALLHYRLRATDPAYALAEGPIRVPRVAAFARLEIEI